jgi:tRNA threonylcarbamoyladenosine biosynthesis protein TsaE
LIKVALPDVDATESLAARLVKILPQDKSGFLLLLQGELGAGKSTLARAMLQKMGIDGPIPSPTYTLVEPYEVSDGVVYHIDLYRLSGMEELDYLGWDDLRDGLILLEWPERVPQLQQQADLLIKLDYDGEGRLATLQDLSDRGRELTGLYVD